MRKFLILGGVHGVEPQSAYVAHHLANYYNLQKSNDPRFLELFDLYTGSLEPKAQLVVIPDFNRYGLKNNTRGNERGVDLNRNLPAFNWSSNYQDKVYFPGTAPASESQTKLLVEIINNNKFDLIISLHTNHFVKNPNPPQVNFDGIEVSWGFEQAKILGKLLELPVTTDIGYSTPGSLGSYCKQINTPCITIEFDDKLSKEGVWALYAPEIIRYLTGDLG
ncbi:MAG: DUF2817 domain-containing protein [Candidatus Caenarcaniphilales bacterium]|nr:DUF2817 domain-containing protein [Candidatus Caenarcaniphilales bacterium]